MFLEEKLPTAVQTPTEPPKRKEIHIHVDRAAKELRIEPKGTLEAVAQMEIIRVLGFPLKGGASQIVATAAGICQRHGWQHQSAWLDEQRMLHVSLWKLIAE
jgi:hypothetical protein